MVDLERAATLSEIALDLNVSPEQAGYSISGRRFGIDPDAPIGCYSVRAAFGYHPETAANTVHAGAVGRCAVDSVTAPALAEYAGTSAAVAVDAGAALI